MAFFKNASSDELFLMLSATPSPSSYEHIQLHNFLPIWHYSYRFLSSKLLLAPLQRVFFPLWLLYLIDRKEKKTPLDGLTRLFGSVNIFANSEIYFKRALAILALKKKIEMTFFLHVYFVGLFWKKPFYVH